MDIEGICMSNGHTSPVTKLLEIQACQKQLSFPLNRPLETFKNAKDLGGKLPLDRYLTNQCGIVLLTEVLYRKMISFQMVLVDPNSEARESYHNRKTLWSYKLTSGIYANKADEMKEAWGLTQTPFHPMLIVSLDKSFTSLGAGFSSMIWGL